MHPFSFAGYVTKLEIYVSVENRPLKVAVYKPLGGLCEYELIKEIVIDSNTLKVGLNMVSYDMFRDGIHYIHWWFAQLFARYWATYYSW